LPELTRYKALTFDCYGTLIDWESGILQALAPLRRAAERQFSDNDVLERYARAESRVQAREYKRYRAVLKEVALEMAEFLKVGPGPRDDNAIADSIGTWEPFPDTVDALGTLGNHYRLAIVSNIDDELFELSAKHLEVPFDFVITSEQVGSYKPSHNNFNRAVERTGLPKDRILHVAQSLYHDIKPASEIGLATVWVNRRKGRAGSGATHPAEATPTLEVPDLATLARLVEEQSRAAG
jgi:2-haloacid dehalogenase